MHTKKHLLAYQISGQTVGIDIFSWETSQLNGNEPWKIILSGDTIPSGYVDIDSIENWDKFALEIANDYSVVKFSIKEICEYNGGWTGLTNTEKDLAIKYYSYPDPTTAVIYLMTTKGWSQAQAQAFLLVSWHKHHLKNIVAYTQRWNYTKLTVLQHISRADGEDLFNTVTTLISLYIDVGILGFNYNDNQDGIIDYIYSAHGFTGQGLEENGYVLNQGTWADFKKALDDVLVCGIYYIYPDLETK
jgi:hypothetical protein